MENFTLSLRISIENVVFHGDSVEYKTGTCILQGRPFCPYTNSCNGARLIDRRVTSWRARTNGCDVESSCRTSSCRRCAPTSASFASTRSRSSSTRWTHCTCSATPRSDARRGLTLRSHHNHCPPSRVVTPAFLCDRHVGQLTRIERLPDCAESPTGPKGLNLSWQGQ